jgi:hypothetical protein
MNVVYRWNNLVERVFIVYYVLATSCIDKNTRNERLPMTYILSTG